MPLVARTLCPVRRTPDAEGEQVTQLLPDEPVDVQTLDDWARVVAPWQPSSLDPAGYPAVLEAVAAGGFTLAERQQLAAQAYRHTAAYDVQVASWLGSVVAPSADGSRFPAWIGATWEHDAPLFFRRAQLDKRLLGGTGDAADRVADELFAQARAAAAA